MDGLIDEKKQIRGINSLKFNKKLSEIRPHELPLHSIGIQLFQLHLYQIIRKPLVRLPDPPKLLQNRPIHLESPPTSSGHSETLPLQGTVQIEFSSSWHNIPVPKMAVDPAALQSL